VSCVGAAVGAAAAYLFFTERGRQVRLRIEPALEDLTRELNNFRGTLNKATGVANEGWRLLNDALGEGGTSARSSHPPQSSPF
jgi:gas vesicle protein